MSIRLGNVLCIWLILIRVLSNRRYFKLGNIPVGWTSVIASIYLMEG